MNRIDHRWLLGLAALLSPLGIPIAAAATPFAETWVMPHSKDCHTTPQTIHPAGLGFVSTVLLGGSVDIDADQRYDGLANGTTEDGETGTAIDPIFETLAAALTNTTTGGVIHLMPGVYREKVSIADSVILRRWTNGAVVFQGACLATNGKAFDCTGTNKTIVFENITILGYDVGIDVNANAVRVIGCEIADCGDGIETGTITDVDNTSIHDCTYAAITAAIGIVHVSDSVLQGNEWGIEYVASGGGGSVTVTDSRILRNVSEGLKVDLSAGSLQVEVHGGEVSGNGGRGVSYSGRNSGSIRLSDVLISGNGSDGVFIENNAGCVTLGTAALSAVATGCRITGNVGDGIELKTSGTSCGIGNQSSLSKMSVFQNSIAFNGGYGLNPNSFTGAVVCTLGQNQISYNTSGAENGTAQCTAAGASSNQVP